MLKLDTCMYMGVQVHRHTHSRQTDRYTQNAHACTHAHMHRRTHTQLTMEKFATVSS